MAGVSRYLGQLGLLQGRLQLDLLLQLQLLSLDLLLLLLLQCLWLDVELLGDLGNCHEGQGDRHGLAGVGHTGTGGAGARLHPGQRLGLDPPELGGGPVGRGGGGDQGPRHHRHRGQHGLRRGGGQQGGVQDWQAGPGLSWLSVLLVLALRYKTRSVSPDIDHGHRQFSYEYEGLVWLVRLVSFTQRLYIILAPTKS